MTVSYNLDVSSVSAFSFIKLLFRWRGSIWKSVKTELALWIAGYYLVFVTYRYMLSPSDRQKFESFAQVIDKKLDYIPLTFMLGFFVTIVVDRWRQVFNNMGWIENAALTLAAVMRGTDKKTILQRRTIIRYLVLTQILVFRDISMRVRRRFPNMESLVVAGFLHQHELEALESVDIAYNRYWAPINWALTIVMDSYKNGNIDAAPSLNNVIGVTHGVILPGALSDEIRSFRTNLALLCNYDWVPIPIAYPQVVFLAVRVYFLICLFSRQYLLDKIKEETAVDLYIPFMTILQFIFFVGWMKVAEALLNPLGEDDDDFECNFLIDKNIATGLAIVDQTFNYCPELVPDKFMDTGFTPIYSDASVRQGVSQGLVGSVEGVVLADPADEVKMVEVTPKVSMIDLTADPHRKFSEKVRRRFTFGNALPGRGRSSSVSPMEFGTSLPANAFNNGVSKSSPCQSPRSRSPFGHTLNKVDEEEDGSMRTSKKTDSDDEEDDDYVHPVIQNELNPPKEQ